MVKRIYFLWFFVFLVTASFVTTSSYAAPPPGGSVEIFTIQKNSADVTSLRNRANLRETVRRSDSLLDVTCWGEQMKNFSAMARLFSDIKFDLGSINFSYDLFCDGLTGNIDVTGPSMESNLNAVFGLNLPSLPGGSICFSGFNVGGEVGAMIASAFELNLFGCALNLNGSQTLTANFQAGFSGACISFQPMTCDKINELWGSAVSGAVKPIQGGGINLGAKSFTKSASTKWLPDSVDTGANTPPITVGSNGPLSSGGFNLTGGGYNSSAGDGSEFSKEFSSESNEDILVKAQENEEKLNGPGNIDSWTTPPNFSADVSTSDILTEMTSGQQSSPP